MTHDTPIEHPLRIWRKSQRLTQEQVAADVDISSNYLSEIETRKRYASLDLAYRFHNISDGALKVTDFCRPRHQSGSSANATAPP